MTTKHDLIFFENRSTPKVVSRGMSFTAPPSYGKQTKRRAATPQEERAIRTGRWVRVDENDNKGGEDGYKKTQMPGREHLVHDMTLDEFLAHHGVKGMKWGVRKDYVATARDAASAAKTKATEGAAAAKKVTTEKVTAAKGTATEKINTATETTKGTIGSIKNMTLVDSKTAANLKANQAKFEAKFQPSEAGSNLAAKARSLTPEQKKALFQLGVGLVVVGGLTYAGYKNQQFIKSLPGLAGQKISAKAFEQAVTHSKLKTWGGGKFIQQSSEDREEFEIPAGNLFHRISMKDEQSFSNFTYTVPDKDDYHRYLVGFRGEKGPNATLHHVTYTSKTPIKVPNLKTTLQSLREAMIEDYSENPAVREKYASTILRDSDVRKQYEAMSGGSWDAGTAMFGGGKSIATRFRENLLSKGYGAIVDEMDAGVIGNRPLVLLDHQNMNAKSASLITAANIKEAEQNLTELTNRKL